MSILQKNIVNKSGVLKNKNIFSEKNPNVFFNNNIKSINLPKFYFTNFIEGKKSPMIKFLKNERRRLLFHEIDFDNEYELKNIETNKEQKKIDQILLETINKKSISTSLIFRLKSKKNTGIQFFFLDDKNGNYEVLFIDLYHMVLPAPNRERGETVAKPKENYEEHKSANYCLSKIFKEL